MQGVTLVEAALVVSIISLIILSALLALNTVTEQRRMTLTATDVVSIRSAISKWAAGGLLKYTSVTVTTGGGGTENQENARTFQKFEQIAGFLPDPLQNLADNDQDLTLSGANPWSGDYRIRPLTNSEPRQWTLEIHDVPEILAEALANQLRNSGSENASVTGNTTVVVTYNE